jgi:6-phosphogluconolactonase
MSRPSITISEPLEDAAGPWLAAAIQECIEARGRCRLALSGGSTPGGTLRWLAAHLPRETHRHLVVTFVDERAVPPDHADANIRLARAAWLDAAPDVSIVPMFTVGPLHAARDRFAATLTTELSGGVDVVLLGVGPDGHIGSLFPGHPALEDEGLCAAITDSPKPPPERLTLTLPVLSAAGWVLLLARGADKASVLRRAWDNDPDIPLARIVPAGNYQWILDAAAASALPAGALEAE